LYPLILLSFAMATSDVPILNAIKIAGNMFFIVN